MHEKYHFRKQDAKEIAAFIVPCLAFNPKQRATAEELLANPWFCEEGGGEGEVDNEGEVRICSNKGGSRREEEIQSINS